MRRTLLRTFCAVLVLSALGLLFASSVPTDANAASRLEEVKKRGKFLAGIRIGMAPYGLVDSSGQTVGFEMDLAREFAKRLGVELETVSVTGATRVPMVESGKVDATFGGLGHTRKREETVDFTIPYMLEGDKLLVKKGSPIRSYRDLVGKTVSAAQGTISEEVLRKAQPQAKIVRFQDLPQAFLALKQGLADAWVSTDFVFSSYVNKNPGEFEIVGEYLIEYPIAVGIPENDSKWRDALNHMLQDMEEDGTFAKIFDKWMGKDSEYKLDVPKLSRWPK
ncbi:MAG: transporter substrate-binding domain-containing protein [Rhodospirillales bacterium]|nr:transporter substrate-binding domain-containing protein [Rhodospirillales bacterium]